MDNAHADRLASTLRDNALINCIEELVRHGKRAEARSLIEQLTLANQNEVITRYALSSIDITALDPANKLHCSFDANFTQDIQTLFGLALSHHKAGDWTRARQLYQEVVAQAPHHSVAWQNLGTLRNAQCDIDGAIEAYRNAIALEPQNATFHANFAEILRRMGNLEQAASEALHAVALQPDNYQAQFNCAIIEAERGNIESAFDHYARAATLNPASAQPHEYLGALKLRLGNNREAEQHYRDGMARDPGNPKLHFGLALALLGQGRLAEGWREWDFRIKCDHFETGLLRSISGREWQGEVLMGKRILVVTEQGFGDTFMFARYLPWLRRQGATVILLCQPALIEVMRGCADIDLLIAKPDSDQPDIDYDYYVWMMSLPVRHASTFASLPRTIPYLHANSARIAQWKQFLSAYSGVKVGLVWAGNPQNRLDLHRTIPFSKLAPLLSVPNTTFFNLQFGNTSPDSIAPVSYDGHLVELSTMLDLDARFIDTAAVMNILDLIITVDTSTCHLAGGLGRPVWTLLAKVCDWRWTDAGNTTPWYPTMNLFRQTESSDWEEVVERVVDALNEFVKQRLTAIGSNQSASSPQKKVDSESQPLSTDPVALCRKGSRLHRDGQLDQAIHHYRAAVNIDPNHWEARHLLGLAFFQKGHTRKALKHITKALEQYPEYADAHSNLAMILESTKNDQLAIAHYQRALEINPKHLEAHINLGGLKYRQGEIHTALHYLNGALRLNHRSSRSHNNIGVIQLDLGHVTRAIDHFERALAIDAQFSDAHSNLGNAHKQLGRFDHALVSYQRAIEFDPSLAGAHWNRSLIWLAQGRFDIGWDEYEWGRQCGERQTLQLSWPEWEGTTLSGKHVLLYSEQGVGDELFFARFFAPLLQQAKQVSFYCDPRLIPLLSRAYPGLNCIAKKNGPIDLTILPSVDYACPIGSLPRYLCRSATLIDSFPAAFLTPDASQAEQWRHRYRALGATLKVGIAWRGGKSDDQKRLRSIPLDQWHDVLTIPGVDFVSLQHGNYRSEIADVASQTGVKIHTWPDTDALRDLDSFAAQIAALDLVIAVDNSTVHLACALGKETWILVPIAADFRWQTQGEATPWYPTARLIRQKTLQHWESELNEIAVMLQGRTKPTAAKAVELTVMRAPDTRSFLDTPILVVGAPRSGTSLLTGILEQCGAWLGTTVPGDEPNPKGYFENELLRDLNKQVLADLGWDPLGVDPLPQSNLPELSAFRNAVVHRLRLQGYNGKTPWAFKCVKTPLLWHLWHNAFPQAQWIIVRRDPKEVVQSVLRSSFFQSHGNDQAWWEQWLLRFSAYLTDLTSAVNSFREISTASLIHGDVAKLQTLIADLGLNWNEPNVQSFIDPTLWGRQNYTDQRKSLTTKSNVDRAPIQPVRNIALAHQIESETYKVLLAGDLTQSDELCRRWLAADPLSDEAYRLLGSSACQQREWQQAIEYFQNGLSFRPASSQLHYNLGVAYYQCGRYIEAVASYRTATAIKPDYIEAWENLAASLAAAGEYRHAAEVYRQLVRTAPFRVASQQALSTLDRILATHP